MRFRLSFHHSLTCSSIRIHMLDRPLPLQLAGWGDTMSSAMQRVFALYLSFIYQMIATQMFTWLFL
ncbi:hypothetical protein M408DRAFT_179684 [Serendipita vermifera MAFF 305830]|uniref:Uncharacterized protein n=1 Tax=Serendipita vermifera MAFF 305830 TaxID=933852 RepID=A0A0C3B3E9_SERVB|nr:hypothetical protein M408DRAFT_179684 [Serendipita vermifera MAFF 305830]